ncbi:MAG: gamma-glutamyl-gamma-aminobutyrate hydrolase family protein [Myxococcaceae bacterium]
MRPHHQRPQHGSAPPRRPSIGIAPGLCHAAAEGKSGSTLSAEAIIKAGGLPFLLPATEERAVIDAYLDRVSGVLILGAELELPPETSGEAVGPLKQGRSGFETTLMQAALSRQLPILGVCGGMQLLNVLLGGTLYQDIQKEIANVKEHNQQHAPNQPHHPVEVKEGTQLAEHIGRGQLMVNSVHRQAVKAAGKNVVVSALSPDGVVEAIEATGYPFVVGVQWNPEMLLQAVPSHLGLYKAFVHRARDQRR